MSPRLTVSNMTSYKSQTDDNTRTLTIRKESASVIIIYRNIYKSFVVYVECSG